ncbi:hypothetical protein TanjilG_14210 [Lupinus angustifolius]|uniref:Uncharacterized protein n=1 Tax=Lupinus angustifolius TaxID=3871 RepID=A0A1J7HKT4_LUPAN|nr:PREDICTED: uncharacterized protein At4g13200, chloroplastic isoform X1 [Lupinus angustifolius]OIW01027.1 hypothetical protein TanjilG_14210 [Lupinus angustifolius]
MNSMVSASPFTTFSSSSSPTFSKPHFPFSSFSPFYKPICIALPFKMGCQNMGIVRCNSSIKPNGPSSGDDDSSSRSVLDAFFLGKAVAEAVNERIESTVGEILSAVGRLQAEQQKQVQGFQEDVFERAKKAKENAAREAKEAQELISKSAVDTKLADSPSPRPSNSSSDSVTSVQSTDASETYSEPANKEDPASSSANDV